MSTRKKVANLWAPLLQSKGNSTTQPMSQKAVSDEFNQLKSELINQMYPIGSIYLTVSTSATGSSSPAQWLGGTWERLPENLALWTASSGAGQTIGAGLPNIKASLEKSYDFGGTYNVATQYAGTGAISTYRDIQGFGTTNNSDITFEIYRGFTFNANNGATVQGIYRDDCTTVQPPAYKVYAWRRTA